MRFRCVLAALVVAIPACVSSTGPDGRSRFCWYAGDTIAVMPVVIRDTQIIRECIWFIADHESCFGKPVGLMTAADCIPGAKYTDL